MQPTGMDREATDLIDLAAPGRENVSQDVDFALGQQFGYPTLARGGCDGVDDAVVAAYAPQSAAIEPLRALRCQLMLRWLNLAPRRMLAVTSPGAREGRSWLAANLATVFAQAGQPTLLIDTDMRAPSQHRLFNLDNSVGLSSLLTARASGRDLFRRIHPQLELFVLPSGMVPPNPQELLLQSLFETVLERFAQLFSVVVLDTPPAMSCADAQIVAARAGSAVLLSRRNRTRVSGLRDTMRCLTDSGVHLLGSIVNDY
jgi:receptor protein-tyrosine kinase